MKRKTPKPPTRRTPLRPKIPEKIPPPPPPPDSDASSSAPALPAKSNVPREIVSDDEEYYDEEDLMDDYAEEIEAMEAPSPVAPPRPSRPKPKTKRSPPKPRGKRSPKPPSEPAVPAPVQPNVQPTLDEQEEEDLIDDYDEEDLVNDYDDEEDLVNDYDDDDEGAGGDRKSLSPDAMMSLLVGGSPQPSPGGFKPPPPAKANPLPARPAKQKPKRRNRPKALRMAANNDKSQSRCSMRPDKMLGLLGMPGTSAQIVAPPPPPAKITPPPPPNPSPPPPTDSKAALRQRSKSKAGKGFVNFFKKIGESVKEELDGMKKREQKAKKAGGGDLGQQLKHGLAFMKSDIGKLLQKKPKKPKNSAPSAAAAAAAASPQEVSAPNSVMKLRGMGKSFSYSNLPSQWRGELLSNAFEPKLADIHRIPLKGYAAPIPGVLNMIWKNLLQVKGLSKEGIFRKTAAKTRIAEAKMSITNGGFTYERDPYVLAKLITNWFMGLNPKIMNALDIDAVTALTDCPLDWVSGYLEPLKGAEHACLMWLLDRLVDVQSQSEINRMDSKALAVCFAPALYEPGGTQQLAVIGKTTAAICRLIEWKASAES